jgi:flavin reductase (DIM6/NTAB) family NADH-FMN oxidoreductase RutF
LRRPGVDYTKRTAVSDYSDLEVGPDVMFLRGLVNGARNGSGPSTADHDSFRHAMRRFGTGVLLLTVEAGDRALGLTINSFCSVSARPPLILISLAHDASCREPLLAGRRFGLSLLGEDHRALAELGAIPGGPKEIDAFCAPCCGDGTAVIAGSIAHLDCVVQHTFEVADHTLVVGRVERAGVGSAVEEPQRPLLYFDRRFHALGDALVERADG